MFASFMRRASLALLVCLPVLALAASPAAAQDEDSLDAEAQRADLGISALIAALARLSSGVVDIGDADAVEAARCPSAAPDGAEVPWLVVEIFTCRAREAGLSPEEARQVAAEALVVSRCESEWKRKAVVFDGRYLDRPHPGTGYRYSAAGVFQFIRATADRWIDGGYAEVTDARRNIDAAARLYLHNRGSGLRGWEDWACAAANDGFKVGSVLPGWPGGPAELPGWLDRYLA